MELNRFIDETFQALGDLLLPFDVFENRYHPSENRFIALRGESSRALDCGTRELYTIAKL